MHKIKKLIVIISITITLLTPVYLVIADDLEPPVISSISYGPHAGVRTDPGFSLYQSCVVTDNVSVADVRVNITGPAGFVSVNTSMTPTSNTSYYYELTDISLAGTYWFYIWAVDTSNNTAQSGNYHMVVFDAYLDTVYVDINNTAGPWDGTAQYPLQYVDDAVSVLAENGTIYINEGFYENISLVLGRSMSFVGENQDTTILDGVGSSTSTIISIDGYHSITLVNLTLQNASTGLQAQHCFNSTISHCVFSQCVGAAVELSDSENFLVTDSTFTFSTIGIQLTNCSSNQFYHNNFLNNTIHVSTFFNSSTNTWDNGATGNYWDNYRALYPNATVIPGTGTWTIPYVVNSTGNNTDYHPWVYPSGDIDTTPPQVHVIYPTGGEVVDGIITIQWSATDDYTTNLDGTILLEYSNDNGNNWFLLTSNYDNTGTFVWNTTTVPNGNRYLISVTATDEFSNVGSDTSDTTFTISNYWNIPPGSIQISGPSIGANGMYYNFTALAVDPEGDQVYYQWDWADGNISDWLGPYNASVLCTTSYAWVSDGLYNISVRARDIGGEESNWSTGHLISIQPLVEFTNIKLGYIYFNLFTFNRSYIYSNFLERLRVVFIISSHVLNADAWAADNVESVTFKASNLWQDNIVEIADNDSTDGFSCNFNISAGMYELNVTAFDGNGTMVDKYSLPVVFYLRIGKYSMGPEDTSRHMLRLNRLRH